MGWKTNQEDWRRGPAWLCTFSYLGNRDHLLNLSPKVTLLTQTSIILSHFYDLIYFLATSRRLLHLSIDTTQKWEKSFKKRPSSSQQTEIVHIYHLWKGNRLFNLSLRPWPSTCNAELKVIVGFLLPAFPFTSQASLHYILNLSVDTRKKFVDTAAGNGRVPSIK